MKLFPLGFLSGLNSFGNNEKTKQGLEMCFGVNYLGHFFLVQQLMPLLIESAPSRVVNLRLGIKKRLHQLLLF